MALVACVSVLGCSVAAGGARSGRVGGAYGGGAVTSSGTGQDAAGSNRRGAGGRTPASDVLRAWDRARSRAFADGDLAALRRLYVPGSTAGTSDVRLLRAYLDRGLHVEGMQMQLLALEVLARTPARLRLLVTDRLAEAVAVGEGVRRALPSDRASTRVVVLRRTEDGGEWRVASVSDSVPTQGGR